MILSPVGESRTLCILPLYPYNEYLQRETIWWNRNPGHQMSYKEDKGWTIFAHAGLNAIRNPSSTVSFEVRSSGTQKNKQTKTTTTTILTHLSKRKTCFFMEELPARGYNDAELSKADSSINFEDRQHLIKEKLKSTAIPLVFNTRYIRNFAGKYIIQTLIKHWNIIDKKVRFKTIFPKPPMIAYSRSENLRDLLVKAEFPTREEDDYSYDDLLRNEEDPPSSLTLQTLQDLELESRGFNVHRFQDNRGPKYTRSYSLQLETRS